MVLVSLNYPFDNLREFSTLMPLLYIIAVRTQTRQVV